MTTESEDGRVNRENLPPVFAPPPPPRIFSEAEGQSALAWLMAQATADEAASATPSTDGDIDSINDPLEVEEMDDKLADMKPSWDKLRAEGVPIEARPLVADLPWSIQFQAQAEADPTGKDMTWWRAHEADFADLE